MIHALDVCNKLRKPFFSSFFGLEDYVQKGKLSPSRRATLKEAEPMINLSEIIAKTEAMFDL